MKVLIACIFVGMSVSSVLGQTTRVQSMSGETDVLQRQVPGNESEIVSATDAFHSSLVRLRLPGGMVRLVTCGQDSDGIAWRPLGAPLAQVLNDIVLADPRYRWEIQDGIVNLLPAAGEPALLGAFVNSFKLEEVSSVSEALDYILALPRLRRRIGELHLKPGLALVKSLSTPNPRRFSVHFNGGTLRQALNQIAQAQGYSIWEYLETHCEGTDEVVIRF